MAAYSYKNAKIDDTLKKHKDTMFDSMLEYFHLRIAKKIAEKYKGKVVEYHIKYSLYKNISIWYSN